MDKEDIFLSVMFTILGLLMVAFLVFVGVLIYRDCTSPTFSLYKDEWTCTASHEELVIVNAGKVMVPTTSTICDQYNRKH